MSTSGPYVMLKLPSLACVALSVFTSPLFHFSHAPTAAEYDAWVVPMEMTRPLAT